MDACDRLGRNIECSPVLTKGKGCQHGKWGKYFWLSVGGERIPEFSATVILLQSSDALNWQLRRHLSAVCWAASGKLMSQSWSQLSLQRAATVMRCFAQVWCHLAIIQNLSQPLSKWGRCKDKPSPSAGSGLNPAFSLLPTGGLFREWLYPSSNLPED